MNLLNKKLCSQHWRGSPGVYVHIPFCSSFCSYCDFPKTLLKKSDQDQLVNDYFKTLALHLRAWLFSSPWSHHFEETKISSLNFGGGTPGLFADHYEPLFKTITSLLANDAEVSLEVNPLNISEDRLKIWKDLGFNRISIGIQTFDSRGIELLGRDHTSTKAIKSIELAKKYFENSNIDLIYAWPGQDQKMWHDDLSKAVSFDVPHLSLYCLTNEKSTILGRKILEQKIDKPTEDEQTAYYETARRSLKKSGFEHEEISNWSKPGFSCRHNWLYWEGGHFIGIGTGAHGFLPSNKDIGLRYSYTPNTKIFIKQNPPDFNQEETLEGLVDKTRTEDSWLAEYVGCCLRALKGIDIAFAEKTAQKTFSPNAKVRKALESNLMTLSKDKILVLIEEEWIRETAWSLEVILSFVK